MVDIAALSTPTPAPSSSGSSSNAGASSSAAAGGVGVGSSSVAANGAADATREDAGIAHPFAELLASLAGTTAAGEAAVATSGNGAIDGEALSTDAGDGQPSDAVYAMVGPCMAAMPVTPLVATTPMITTTSLEACVDPIAAQVPLGQAAHGAAASAPVISADASDAVPASAGGTTSTVDAPDAAAAVAGSVGPSPAVTDANATAASALTDPAAQTPVATPAPAPAETPAQSLTAAATATTASTQASASTATTVDTKAAGKGRARSMTSDKASTDATSIDADDAVPSTATSPTMTPTALSASSPVNGDLMSGGGPGRDHHSAASQLANSASTVSTASTATSTGATSVASTASVASTGAAAASQAQPWEQVLAVLRPTRRFTDGSHRLSIQMTPDDLGTVTIELSMDRGRLSMHMLTETQGAADALRSSLHELRADLEGSGQRTGSFEVAQQWAQHRQNQSEFARAARFSGLDTNAPLGTITAPVGAIDLTTSAGATSDGRLDVRI